MSGHYGEQNESNKIMNRNSKTNSIDIFNHIQNLRYYTYLYMFDDNMETNLVHTTQIITLIDIRRLFRLITKRGYEIISICLRISKHMVQCVNVYNSIYMYINRLKQIHMKHVKCSRGDKTIIQQH